MPYIQQTQITCHKYGYPVHLATNSTVRGNPPRCGAQNPFTQLAKKNKYSAQGSKFETYKGSPVAQARHVL